MTADASPPGFSSGAAQPRLGFPEPGEIPEEVSLCIGSFDGVHAGHRRLVRAVVADARRRGGTPVVLTFHPHPRCVVDPSGCPPLLTTVDERAGLVRELDVDDVCVLPFTRELSAWSATRFCDELTRSMRVRSLLTGPGFAVGHDRQGGTEFLRNYGAEHGFALRTVPPAMWRRLPVSSTRIRAELREGRVGAARQMLGRDYELTGVVAAGDRRGRTLGFPTANVAVAPERCLPAPGVYATWLTTADARLRAATSIGFRPTFNGEGLTVEAFALDFEGDLYGATVKLSFVSRLRAERRFVNADALVAQMKRDVESVKRRLER